MRGSKEESSDARSKKRKHQKDEERHSGDSSDDGEVRQKKKKRRKLNVEEDEDARRSVRTKTRNADEKKASKESHNDEGKKMKKKKKKEKEKEKEENAEGDGEMEDDKRKKEKKKKKKKKKEEEEKEANAEGDGEMKDDKKKKKKEKESKKDPTAVDKKEKEKHKKSKEKIKSDKEKREGKEKVNEKAGSGDRENRKAGTKRKRKSSEDEEEPKVKGQKKKKEEEEERGKNEKQKGAENTEGKKNNKEKLPSVGKRRPMKANYLSRAQRGELPEIAPENMPLLIAKATEEYRIRAAKKPRGNKMSIVRFSPLEDALLLASIRNFCANNGLGGDNESAFKFIDDKLYKDYHAVWNTIGSVLPHRPTERITERVIRTMTSAKKGAWTEEELAELTRLYHKHGRDYVLISKELGRWYVSVRDKMRSVLGEEGKRVKSQPGYWHAHEDRRLIELLRRASDNFSIKVPLGGHFWIEVARRMPGRDYYQCRVRWMTKLDPDADTSIYRVGWTPGDDWQLLQYINERNYTYVEDVDWHDVVEKLNFPAYLPLLTRNLAGRDPYSFPPANQYSSPNGTAMHFLVLVRRHGADRYAPLEDIIEKLAGPIRQQFVQWEADGMPRTVKPPTKYQLATERMRQYVKDLCAGEPVEDLDSGLPPLHLNDIKKLRKNFDKKKKAKMKDDYYESDEMEDSDEAED